MFVSLPQYKFPFPANLGDPGSQYWRIVELTLHAPWFLLSIVIGKSEDADFNLTQTLCIGWDSDLTDLLRSLEPKRIKGIVCMLPAWQSANGQWTSHEVREVWLCRSTAGESVVLTDSAGRKFDGEMALDHVAPVEHELLLSLPPPDTGTRPPSHASRRCRRASPQARQAGA